MNEFEEFKKTILRIINYREEVPEEIINSFQNIFKQIQEIYANNGCLNNTILEILEGEISKTRIIINDKIGSERRNQHFEEFMAIANRMESHIQDMENEEQTHFRTEFAQPSEGTIQLENKIAELVEMVGKRLTEIDSIQGRFLYSTGQLSDSQIEEIQYQVLSAIKNFQNKNDEMIAIFQQDEQRLREEIIKQYDEILEPTQTNDEKTFRESLNVGISLEEQAEFARECINSEQEQKENGTDKPKLLVDELPDLLL